MSLGKSLAVLGGGLLASEAIGLSDITPVGRGGGSQNRQAPPGMPPGLGIPPGLLGLLNRDSGIPPGLAMQLGQLQGQVSALGRGANVPNISLPSGLGDGSNTRGGNSPGGSRGPAANPLRSRGDGYALQGLYGRGPLENIAAITGESGTAVGETFGGIGKFVGENPIFTGGLAGGVALAPFTGGLSIPASVVAGGAAGEVGVDLASGQYGEGPLYKGPDPFNLGNNRSLWSNFTPSGGGGSSRGGFSLPSISLPKSGSGKNKQGGGAAQSFSFLPGVTDPTKTGKVPTSSVTRNRPGNPLSGTSQASKSTSNVSGGNVNASGSTKRQRRQGLGLKARNTGGSTTKRKKEKKTGGFVV